jgi:rRNA-processing protein FCF1
MAFDRVRGDKIHKTVILDSSAILMFFEFSLDWENELTRLIGAHHVVVPSAVVKELKILSSRDTAGKKVAAALKLVEKYETIEEDTQYADDTILKIAQKTMGIVVTNDSVLRQRLKKQGNSVVFLRGKKKLALDE